MPRTADATCRSPLWDRAMGETVYCSPPSHFTCSARRSVRAKGAQSGGCAFAGPQGPSLSLAGPQGPSLSLAGPQGPSLSLAGPQGPSLSLAGPQGRSLPSQAHKALHCLHGPARPFIAYMGPQGPSPGLGFQPVEIRKLLSLSPEHR
eukprot:361812-Chlamydomonas_euryale.AAC.2